MNPKNTSQDVETGPTCTPMSIIRNCKISISMSTSVANDKQAPIKFSITPFWGSFPEKYKIADDDTSVTVAQAMELVSDETATTEDVTPIFDTGLKLPVLVLSDKSHPLGTVNDAEAIADWGLSVDATMEGVDFDMEQLQSLFQHGSKNIRSTLKSCLGKTRHFTLDSVAGKATRNLYFRNFSPKAVRRINPHTFFGLLFHMPLETDIDSFYSDTALAQNVSHVGFRVKVRYDEWNSNHLNDM